MTEYEWQNSTNPTPMLEFLRGKRSDRKSRLFAVACGRRLGSHLTDADRQAIDFAERYADGLADRAERRAAATSEGVSFDIKLVTSVDMAALVQQPGISVTSFFAERLVTRLVRQAVPFPTPVSGSPTYMREVQRIMRSPRWREAVRIEQSYQLHLIIDLFGNPFRPTGVDPSWLTSDVVTLTTGIYRDRGFDRMLILADALQDAGCDNADILTHCRSDGPHVRGCWVVDLLLGKE